MTDRDTGEHETTGLFGMLVTRGPIPALTALLMSGALMLMPSKMRRHIMRHSNPLMRLANDQHASLRTQYLIARYGWAMEYAAADPKWLRKVGMPFAAIYMVPMLVNAVLILFFRVILNITIMATSTLRDVFSLFGEWHTIVERGVFGYAQLRDAERTVAYADGDEAHEYIMRKKANVKPGKSIPTSTRIKHYESIRKMDEHRAEVMGKMNELADKLTKE